MTTATAGAQENCAIFAEGLTRKYGDLTAVEDVSFQIGSREVVGLGARTLAWTPARAR